MYLLGVMLIENLLFAFICITYDHCVGEDVKPCSVNQSKLLCIVFLSAEMCNNNPKSISMHL